MTSQMMPEHMPEDHAAFEVWIIERAVEFSTVRFKGRGFKDRRNFTSLTDAIDDARDDPRAMVYASTASGRSTMIERKSWDKALSVVGSKA